MRAVGHTITDVFFLSGHTQLAPFGTGGHDHRLGVNFFTGRQHHCLDVTLFHTGDFQVLFHRHVVIVHVRLQGTGQFRAGGFLHGDQVFDIHGVFHLATDTVGDQGHFQPLAGTVDGRRHTGRTTTDHGHVLQWHFFASARLGNARVMFEQLVDQLGCGHLAVGEQLTIQVDAGHPLNVALVDHVLKQAAINHFRANVRVQQGELVQGLDHVRAVVTAQADKHFEMHVAFGIGDHALEAVVQLDVCPGCMQKRQHQGIEFVACGNTGETDTRVFSIGFQQKTDRATQGVARIAFFERQVVTDTSDVGKKADQFIALVVGACLQHESDFLLHVGGVALESLQNFIREHESSLNVKAYSVTSKIRGDNSPAIPPDCCNLRQI